MSIFVYIISSQKDWLQLKFNQEHINMRKLSINVFLMLSFIYFSQNILLAAEPFAPGKNKIAWHNFFPYPGGWPKTTFKFTTYYNSLIESTFVAGVLLGHMLNTTNPDLYFDKDYLYGSILVRLLQEDGGDIYGQTNSFILPNNITVTNDLIKYNKLNISTNLSVFGPGQGGPYQINSYATPAYNPNNENYISVLNYNSIKKGLGYSFVNTNTKAPSIFNQNTNYPSPILFNNVYFAPIVAACFTHLDFLVISNTTKLWPDCLTNMSNESTIYNGHPLPFLDIFLNSYYNSGLSDPTVKAIIQAIAKPTTTTNSAIASYSDNFTDYAKAMNLTDIDEARGSYSRQYRFYLDQIYNNKSKIDTWITLTNDDIKFSYGDLMITFSACMTQLGYEQSSKYILITKLQADQAFKESLPNGTTTLSIINMSSEIDRKAMYTVIDSALTNLENTFNFKFTDISDSDLSAECSITNVIPVPQSNSATITWNVEKLNADAVPTGVKCYVFLNSSTNPITATNNNGQFSVEFDGLTDSTAYDFTICAVDGTINIITATTGDYVDNSNVLAEFIDSFTTTPNSRTKTLTINNIQVDASDAEATISWNVIYGGDINSVTTWIQNGISDAKGYWWQSSWPAPTIIPYSIKTPINNNAATYSTTLTGLNKDTRYFYMITTTPAADPKDAFSTAGATFTTTGTPQPKEKTITITQGVITSNETSATINWSVSDTDTTNSPNLESSIKFNNGATTIVAAASGIYTYITDSLKDSTTYQFTISATDKVNTATSINGTVTTTTPSVTTLDIQNLKVVQNSTQHSATISWTVSGIGINVENISNTIVVTNSPTVSDITLTGGIYSVNLTNLTQGATYSYTINATDTITTTTKTSSFVAATESPTTIITPYLYTTSVTSNTATIAWAVDYNGTGSLTSSISFNNGPPITITPISGEYTYTASGLNSATSYPFIISATDGTITNSIDNNITTYGGNTNTNILNIINIQQMLDNNGTSDTISWELNTNFNVNNIVNTIKYGADFNSLTTLTPTLTNNIYSINLTNLTPNTIYYYIISATDNTDSIVVNYIDLFSTPPTLVNNIIITLDQGYPKTTLSSTESGFGSANFSWRVTESNPTGRLIVNFNFNNKPIKLVNDNNGHYQATISDLNYLINYPYIIYATDKNVNNAISGSVRIPNPTSGAITSTNYSWTSQPGPTQNQGWGVFTFAAATGGTLPHTYSVVVTRADDDESSVDSIKQNLLTYQIINMETGVDYIVTVTAFDAHGASSSEKTFKINNNWN